jgi:hypothetical protein
LTPSYRIKTLQLTTFVQWDFDPKAHCNLLRFMYSIASGFVSGIVGALAMTYNYGLHHLNTWFV